MGLEEESSSTRPCFSPTVCRYYLSGSFWVSLGPLVDDLPRWRMYRNAPKKRGPKKKFLQDVSSMMFPHDFKVSNCSIYLVVATTDCNCRETFMGPSKLAVQLISSPFQFFCIVTIVTVKQSPFVSPLKPLNVTGVYPILWFFKTLIPSHQNSWHMDVHPCSPQ